MKYPNSQKGPFRGSVYSILWMRQKATNYWCTFTIFVVFSSKTDNVENGQKLDNLECKHFRSSLVGFLVIQG